MNARLKVLHQKSNIKSIRLQATTMVGRSTDCDLKIASNLVSRLHCRITVNEEAVIVEDLGSANGTFVDGESLTPNQPKTVNPGAKLVIGPAEFIVEYVTSTSNTVVIRRSSEGSRPALQELRNVAASDDSGLLLTATGNSSEETVSDSRLSKPRPAAVPPKPIEAAKSVPARESILARQPQREIPAPAAQKSSLEGLVPKTPEKGPSVPVSAVPVAKVAVVMAAPVEVQPAPRRVEPLQPQTATASQPDASAPARPPKVAPAPPPVTAQEQPFEFVEFEETVSMIDETTQFRFGETTEDQRSPKPAEKVQKAKPLKSLFSVFGGKPKPAKPSSATKEPSEASAPSEPEATSASHEVQTELVFGAAESPPEQTAKKDDSQLDDDFQNFLRQF